jgi:hypothetical protein
MKIGELIDGPVQPDAGLDAQRIIKLFFALDKITDYIPGKDSRIIERKECVGEIIH